MPATTELSRVETTPSISPETRSLVEQRLPEESDEVKYHMMALIDAIKRRAETEINSAGDITRDGYVTAMRQAQETLQKTGDFFNEQRASLEDSIADVEDLATKRWETLLADAQKVGNRLDRAVNAAWKILTEPDSEPADLDEPPPQ
ncbi:MAG: hypothetical protein HC838_10300 [Spirulinaceae cyanobacterium RM2_2_10]|nr:hypothetical protein [Spirulinaceae cyanobacterium RM2_2_10]